MPERVEPPVLLSRLMLFVFATAVVVLGVLGVTLWRLFPLNRPQVFFLTTQLRPDMEVRLYSMPVKSDAQSINLYKTSFVKEYIKARNEIVKNANVMHRKWGNGNEGVINMWSLPTVYNDFTNTAMWNVLMRSDATVGVTCTVEFPAGAVKPRTSDGMTYNVSFSYLCTNNNGQTTRKDYTIIIGLKKDDTAAIRWGERLDNPLGMRVERYEIESDNGDPLDFN